MTAKQENFWSNRFHLCALAAGFLAAIEGRLHDSLYVRELAYGMFEEGAFKDRVLECQKPPAADARKDAAA